jgi:hypothetical protein
MSPEKRHFSRIPIEGNAALECGGTRWNTRLLDVSLKGALVNRPDAWTLQLGDHCHLRLTLPDSDVTIEMDVAVAHENDHLVGFSCRQIDIASISHLRRLIELNLGDEGLLERELAELLGQRG